MVQSTTASQAVEPGPVHVGNVAAMPQAIEIPQSHPPPASYIPHAGATFVQACGQQSYAQAAVQQVSQEQINAQWAQYYAEQRAWAAHYEHVRQMQAQAAAEAARQSEQTQPGVNTYQHPGTLGPSQQTPIPTQASQMVTFRVQEYQQGTVAPAPHPFDEECMRIFIDQVERLYPLLDAPDIPPLLPPSSATKQEKAAYAYISRVYRNSDKLLPFRDLAPSRRTILGPLGPYSPPNLRSRAGFFSTLVYRAITHHSEFLTSAGEVFFHDLDHFTRSVSQYQNKSPKFFCDPSAYGPSTRLSLDFAEAFWTASGKSTNNDWLIRDVGTTFEQLIQMFATSADFPSIGPFIAYQLAADYAVAGVIPIPSPKEMGRLIFRTGKDTVVALIELGFCCRTEEEAGEAFETLAKEVISRVSTARRDQMSFNVILLEHMLRKHRHLSTKLYTSLLSLD
ncbi:hypothetical protein DFP72DRAFT_1063426 [Ephemerocybe angulata]|uniref:Uncharacterized protein n=1 Tax=Ephemerocybe angulata TaxID=980116 RepID=A0A8H6I6A0_9AGAR|nr:hypothetical protein DFP72DRAFT_1063426 [Tulosesus angulatus]